MSATLARVSNSADGQPDNSSGLPEHPSGSWRSSFFGRGTRIARPKNAAPNSAKPISAREIVYGLDRREMIFGSIAAVAAGALAAVGYYLDHRSTTVALREDANTILVAMIIGACMIALGTALRRRAFLGFAALLVGLEQVSFDSQYFGIIYLGFGGWLVYRAMQRSKAMRNSTPSAAAVKGRAVAGRARTGTTSRGPKASKRYTPPKPHRSRTR